MAYLTPVFILLFPAIACADGIAWEYLIPYGCACLLPITGFILMVETTIIGLSLKMNWWQTLRFVFWANALSVVACIPVKIAGELAFNSNVYGDLYSFFRFYLLFSVLAYVAYLVVTVVSEAGLGLWWYRKKMMVLSAWSIVRAVAWANLATYAVLVPIHYWISYPETNLRKYTADTQWAQRPAARVIYLDDATNHLMQIDTDGRNRKVILPFSMTDYMFSPDMDTFLFTDMNRVLYWRRKSAGKTIRISNHFPWTMIEADLSPSGDKVAYTERRGLDLWLMIYDVPSGTLTELNEINEIFDPKYSARRVFQARADNETLVMYFPVVVAWSRNETVLYTGQKGDLPSGGKSILRQLVFSKDANPKVTDVRLEDLGFCENHGRFFTDTMEGTERTDEYTGVVRGHDEYETLRADIYEWYGPRRYLSITKAGQEIVRFSDKPGLLKFSLGGTEPSFIQNGREFLFEARWPRSIYLINLETKTLGKVTDGHDHIVLTESYTKKRFFENMEK